MSYLVGRFLSLSVCLEDKSFSVLNFGGIFNPQLLRNPCVCSFIPMGPFPLAFNSSSRTDLSIHNPSRLHHILHALKHEVISKHPTMACHSQIEADIPL